jgi:alkanesulfonate monooxygenase SsuD/methylene tetrahydromethanopterin reductase-like flavin-dependent oxidoreductase (luciferase family)
VGTPQQVKESIIAVSERYQTKEIMIASPVHQFEARVRSYRLIAEAFGL